TGHGAEPGPEPGPGLEPEHGTEPGPQPGPGPGPEPEPGPSPSRGGGDAPPRVHRRPAADPEVRGRGNGGLVVRGDRPGVRAAVPGALDGAAGGARDRVPLAVRGGPDQRGLRHRRAAVLLG